MILIAAILSVIGVVIWLHSREVIAHLESERAYRWSLRSRGYGPYEIPSQPSIVIGALPTAEMSAADTEETAELDLTAEIELTPLQAYERWAELTAPKISRWAWMDGEEFDRELRIFCEGEQQVGALPEKDLDEEDTKPRFVGSVFGSGVN